MLVIFTGHLLVRPGSYQHRVTFPVIAPVYGPGMRARTSCPLRLIRGGRRDGDGRETVDVVRHDTGAVASVVWTLPRLLAAIARHRGPGRGGAPRTFSVGRGKRRLAIVTAGPSRFDAHHPVWRDADRAAGAMSFSALRVTDVRRVLQRFYAGAPVDRCFEGLAGELLPGAASAVERSR
jgi:hypothetical protein